MRRLKWALKQKKKLKAAAVENKNGWAKRFLDIKNKSDHRLLDKFFFF